jgi:hypothetical protein
MLVSLFGDLAVSLRTIVWINPASGANECPNPAGGAAVQQDSTIVAIGSTSARRGPIIGGPLRQFNVGPGSAMNSCSIAHSGGRYMVRFTQIADVRRPVKVLSITKSRCGMR